MGATARCRRSLEPLPRAPGDGREPLACAPSRRAQPREDARRTIVTDKVNEMWGTDMSQTVTIEEVAGSCFRRCRTREPEIIIGIHAARSANRFEALEPVRQGVYSVLRLHRARRGAWAQAASRSWLQLHVRRFPERDQMSGHRSFAILRARTPRAMASPSASSEP